MLEMNQNIIMKKMMITSNENDEEEEEKVIKILQKIILLKLMRCNARELACVERNNKWRYQSWDSTPVGHIGLLSFLSYVSHLPIFESHILSEGRRVGSERYFTLALQRRTATLHFRPRVISSSEKHFQLFLVLVEGCNLVNEQSYMMIFCSPLFLSFSLTGC